MKILATCGRPQVIPSAAPVLVVLRPAWLCSTGSKHSKPCWLRQCPGHRLPNRTPPSRRRWCQVLGKHWPRPDMRLPVFKTSVLNQYVPAGPWCRYVSILLPATCYLHFTKVSANFEHQVWGLPVLFWNAFTPIFSQRSPQKRWQDTFFSSSVHGVQASLHAASTKGTHEPSAPKSGMIKASSPITIPMAPITYYRVVFEIKTCRTFPCSRGFSKNCHQVISKALWKAVFFHATRQSHLAVLLQDTTAQRQWDKDDHQDSHYDTANGTAPQRCSICFLAPRDGGWGCTAENQQSSWQMDIHSPQTCSHIAIVIHC